MGNDAATWTAGDLTEMKRLGVSLPSQKTRERSAWTPERVLQAACAGEVTVDETLFEYLIYIDGQPATDAEIAAVVDLMDTDHLVMVERRVACTNHGRDLLARWAKYQPCIRNNNPKENQ